MLQILLIKMMCDSEVNEGDRALLLNHMSLLITTPRVDT